MDVFIRSSSVCVSFFLRNMGFENRSPLVPECPVDECLLCRCTATVARTASATSITTLKAVLSGWEDLAVDRSVAFNWPPPSVGRFFVPRVFVVVSLHSSSSSSFFFFFLDTRRRRNLIEMMG